MANAEVKALSTINTVLKCGDTGATVAKLCPIKNYPDLGGDPEKITVTDLDDEDEASMRSVRNSSYLSQWDLLVWRQTAIVRRLRG